MEKQLLLTMAETGQQDQQEEGLHRVLLLGSLLTSSSVPALPSTMPFLLLLSFLHEKIDEYRCMHERGIYKILFPIPEM